jgi:shikimate kinase
MRGPTGRAAARLPRGDVWLPNTAENLPLPHVSSKPACHRIVLIGARGCGKSTVGRLLAQALQYDFVDTDTLIETAAGQSIAEIFASAGEAAFRELESQAIEQALARRPCVISVGGGAVVRRRNRERLQRSAYCVWLTADAEELQGRIAADAASLASRPALTDPSGLEEMRQVLAQRRPLYEALAQQVVETGGRTPDEVAREILARLRAGPAATES